MATTVNELIVSARQRAGLESDPKIQTDEAVNLANDVLRECHYLLLKSHGDQNLSVSADISISNNSTGSLPSDFLQDRGLDRQVGDSWLPVDTFASWRERGNSAGGLCYQVDTGIRISPQEACAGTYRLWYYPDYTDLSGSATISSKQQPFVRYHKARLAELMLQKLGLSNEMISREASMAREEVSEVAQDRKADHGQAPDVSVGRYWFGVNYPY